MLYRYLNIAINGNKLIVIIGKDILQNTKMKTNIRFYKIRKLNEKLFLK